MLEHSGKFNRAVTRLVDFKDDHVKDNKYVCCLFKQSLNLQYTEVLQPVEVTKPHMSYYEVLQELLRLELAGKVFKVFNTPTANVATAAPARQYQSDEQQRQQGFSN